MRLVPGTRVGPYEVVGTLGAGGMGEVYRARDARLGRDVALKLLPEEVASDDDRLMRFGREARALAALNHPNIAQIYGVEDRALVMELVDGDDLAQRITRGPMPIDEALAVAKQIADALEAAHEAGIVHRDLKPANIKIRADGAVKVLDFGLAKPAVTAGVDVSGRPTMTSPALTMQGVMLGTAAYMSPEQARGRPVDKRADIWAFGCVLFEMLTGSRAFPGETVSDIVAAVLKEPPPLELLPPATSPAIMRVVRRCLEKDPARRLRDIGDAKLEIEQARSEDEGHQLPTPTPTASRPPSRRGLAALGAVAMGLLGLAAYARSGRGSPSIEVAKMSVTPAASAPLLVDSAIPDLAISRDGRRIIYQARRSDPEGVRLSAVQLMSRPLDTFDAAAVANIGLFPAAPFPSADGAWLGFQTAAGPNLSPVLAKAPTTGGPMSIICDLGPRGTLRGASWASDGRIVFATNRLRTGLFEVAAAGGTPTQMTEPSSGNGERNHAWPDVLPDNAGVLFTITRPDSTFDVAVLPSGSTMWRTLIRGGSAARYMPSGHVVYVAGGSLYAVGFDIRSLQVTTQPVALEPDVVTKESGGADYAVSANGTLAYVPGQRQHSLRRLVWLDREGHVAPLPLEPGAYRGARMSPDGSRIAVTVEEQRGTSSVWVYDTSRDIFTRLTPRDESVTAPLWSPDGTRIAFWSYPRQGIFTMAADGSDTPTRLTQFAAGEQLPDAWSPDGATLAFIQNEPGVNLFAVSTAPPHDIRPLATGTGANVEATFSPDGKWVSYVASEGGTAELVVGPVASLDRRWAIGGSGRHPVWSADGREVLFFDSDAIRRIAIDPATGKPMGKPLKVVDVPADIVSSRADPTPDGKRWLMMRRVDSPDRPSEIRVVVNWIEEVKTKLARAAPVSGR